MVRISAIRLEKRMCDVPGGADALSEIRRLKAMRYYIGDGYSARMVELFDFLNAAGFTDDEIEEVL